MQKKKKKRTKQQISYIRGTHTISNFLSVYPKSLDIKKRKEKKIMPEYFNQNSWIFLKSYKNTEIEIYQSLFTCLIS